VETIRPTTLSTAAATLFALLVCAAAPAGATPQQPAGALPASTDQISLDRIAEALRRTPERPLRLDVHLPVATFRTSVVQRVFLLTFEEQLRKDFRLNILQRQSQDWSSRCCGIDVLRLVKSLDERLQRREARKIREEVARELAQVVAAAKK
jgi:hypothetical protein